MAETYDELARALLEEQYPLKRNRLSEDRFAESQRGLLPLPPLSNALAGGSMETPRWRAPNQFGGDEAIAAQIGADARQGDWLPAAGGLAAVLLGAAAPRGGKGPMSSQHRLSPTEFGDYLQKKYGADVYFTPQRDDLKLHQMIVPKDQRNQGVGSAIMQEINAYADANGKRVVLSPGLKDDNTGTTSRNRLVDFYRRFDYVPNKGRNKDYRISEGMFRRPVTEE